MRPSSSLSAVYCATNLDGLMRNSAPAVGIAFRHANGGYAAAVGALRTIDLLFDSFGDAGVECDPNDRANHGT